MTFLLFGCLIHNAQADGKALIVESSNGSKTAFVLSKNPELTFVDKFLRIDMNGKNTDFEISDVRQFYFDEVATDIAELKATEVNVVYLSNDKIVIEGIEPNIPVQLYALNGAQIGGKISVSGNHVEISLFALPKGIYFIKISNQQPFKIYRK